MKTTPRSFTLVTLTLLGFACLPATHAVIPPPDGGYPGGNTAEGQNALFSLTTGGFNTAVGYFSLRTNTTASFNTAIVHYKSDTECTPEFGLIAEEVARVDPALVLPDREGKPYTVRYEAVNAMLLNEFLKEHRRVEELKSAMAQQREDFEAAIAQQQKTTEALIARLNEQEARIQKVSDHVQPHRSASPMLVENE